MGCSGVTQNSATTRNRGAPSSRNRNRNTTKNGPKSSASVFFWNVLSGLFLIAMRPPAGPVGTRIVLVWGVSVRPWAGRLITLGSISGGHYYFSSSSTPPRSRGGFSPRWGFTCTKTRIRLRLADLSRILSGTCFREVHPASEMGGGQNGQNGLFCQNDQNDQNPKWPGFLKWRLLGRFRPFFLH